MLGEPGQTEGGESTVPQADKVSATIKAYLDYLRASSKSPFFNVSKDFHLGKEGSAPVWSEAQVKEFNAKLVDSGILPETITTEEIGISSEDKARLQGMAPAEQSEAVLTGMRNIARKANGLTEIPGGVKFQRVEVTRNNRTGEERVVPLPPKPQSSTPNK